MELRRKDGRPLLIGHRGAAALAPENTLEAIERALAHGVDLVELDVVRAPDGLVLAHSLSDLRHGVPAPTLDAALAFLAAQSADVGVQVDLKARGVEEEVVAALRRHELLTRAFVSSFHTPTLRALRAVEPALPLALTYPRDRLGVAGRGALRPFVRGSVATLRRVLPRLLDRRLARAGASAAALHWAVVSRAAIERCHARGAAAIAWTVDDAEVAESLIQAGIDGIITNDPRIFEALSIT